MAEENLRIITPQGVNSKEFSKTKIIIGVGVILAVLILVIFVKLIFQESNRSSEDIYKKYNLERPSTNAPCYEDLEEIKTRLEKSCSNESLLEIIQAYQEEYRNLPQGEDCARTLNNFSIVIIEVCGEESLNRTMDLVMNQMMENMNAYSSCFDAVGSIFLSEATKTSDSLTLTVELIDTEVKLVGIGVIVSYGSTTTSEIWRNELFNENTTVTKTFTKAEYANAEEVSIYPIIQEGNTEKSCDMSSPKKVLTK